MNVDLILNLLKMTVEASTPYLLITIGGVFVARAGVFNISLEGCTEFAAFAGILFGVLSGNILIGAFSALLVACIPACLLQALFGTRSNLVATDLIDPMKMRVDVPVLRSIPVLNSIFNNQTRITYLTFGIVICLIILMYRTKFGIYVRVTGENVGAAKSVGVRTNQIKLICLLLSAATCALAGLNLSVEEFGIYTINMTANRWFICLSAINCGRKETHRACVYAVIFGFARALQTILNNYVPAAISSLIGILPYVTIIVALLIVEIPNARRNHLRIFKGA